MKDLPNPNANLGKFQDSLVTADGSTRASVALSNPETLWFNTGTLCNIECANCYILSSPRNDALVYLTAAEVEDYLDQLEERNWRVREIAFTGGEPFMNPEMCAMAGAALERGYEVLILTNAMRPMMRKTVRQDLLVLNEKHPGKMTLRISLDHHSAEIHDTERGAGSYAKTLEGMAWLRDNRFQMAVAGRITFAESESEARQGFADLFAAQGFDIDSANPGQTVLFPEMDEAVEVPEITTACWGILNKAPEDVMCASSRMVVKRKGAEKPAVLACTLLPYAPGFELGTTLAEAEKPVSLNHPHCAKFCVLGGASCSA
ncbi:radical SAM protein [Phaeobacter gallaeciensis]|uniref:radical SAM protein n=1 Tax=Phaeobacter gallaeciensis TaxID=60890 RepID=UPI00237F409F|nr:radical SAM protein [Phaeobacter gallaeciensis]MDE4096447.1 radical SAM protein [Phaeobacter gallaeciensis]MDE4105258.1 radical SAM protein [Phaeobacter gallaeciensis]MDE4109714.1 radical SAM protein [Phaeobacter gallaeciensis]MDE4114182.1 radical SAM protein [Phaeobacter gallaeciensis]MDE4118649.1 radical SAM protein [Phaeobacter gallaeciensis]